MTAIGLKGLLKREWLRFIESLILFTMVGCDESDVYVIISIKDQNNDVLVKPRLFQYEITKFINVKNFIEDCLVSN